MNARAIRLHLPSGASRITVGSSLPLLRALTDPKRCIVVTDANVKRSVGSSFNGYKTVEIGEGESNKTLEAVEIIYRALMDAEADRNWTIVGVGGGIVCDVSGFAAATYMRGIRCGFVPTTLLAQLDASVGGKTAVNFGGYKNLVGVFRQPDFVLCDPVTLMSLPEMDFRAGLAEAVKHAVIASPRYFRFLEKQINSIIARKPEVLTDVVAQSIRIKASIVSKDECESGLRAKLNLGHTIGHGIEAITGLRHGEAVAIGIMAACRMAVRTGFMSQSHSDRIRVLLERFSLPTRLPANLPSDAACNIAEAIRHDKKRSDDFIKFALPRRIGSVVIRKMEIASIASVIEELSA